MNWFRVRCRCPRCRQLAEVWTTATGRRTFRALPADTVVAMAVCTRVAPSGLRCSTKLAVTAGDFARARPTRTSPPPSGLPNPLAPPRRSG